MGASVKSKIERKAKGDSVVIERKLRRHRKRVEVRMKTAREVLNIF